MGLTSHLEVVGTVQRQRNYVPGFEYLSSTYDAMSSHGSVPIYYKKKPSVDFYL